MRPLFLVGLLLFPALAVARAETVLLGADEWCPYNCAPGAARPGYMIEIAKHAFGAAGLEVEYRLMPWNRALSAVRAGEIDGAVGAGTGDLPEAIFPKQSLGLSLNVLARKADKAGTFVYRGAESLAALRIGGVQGYSYDNGPIDAYIKKAAGKGEAVQLIAGTELQSQNLRKLLADRIDAILDNDYVLKLAVAEMQPAPAIAYIPLGEPDGVFIVFAPKKPSSRRYADVLDTGLTELRRSGRLKTILASYGLEDWVK